MNGHHKKAVAILGVTAVTDVALGLAFGAADHVGFWHGLYCATGTATTVVPLFSSVFAFFTAGMTADHIDTRHKELKEHVTKGAAYKRHV